ncbi:glycine betaine ABC transporter substrate-binding protein [Marmoricola sp. Leaf446]|uniref:ABC transporter substrate-binding protein n=1 Tax=Marmoricola sp. Leaf446 TaxID=1736379 RepID=UPI0009EC5EE1|nr:glycine betaine ABC transporter substrate-binding protein [Marmoricola sp. Leaf446]
MRRGVVATAALAVSLALGVAGCGEVKEPRGSSQPQGASLRITLGTQEFPEGRILGELWRQVLAVNGYAVDLRKGVGPAQDLDEALKADEVDGYVAYTGTVLSVVAGEDPSGLDPEETYDAVREFYAGQDMVVSPMTPFENTDAVATTTTYAEEEGLTSIGDLADVSGLRLGARPEFEDLDLGLAGLRSTYGLTDVEFTPVELGEQYAALDRGEVDAVDAFTTDPALRDGDYRLLEDPERLFGSQNVVMVVGEEKLAEIDDERFLAVVDSVNELLTEDVMVDLNAAVEQGRDEESVARTFLRENDLLERYRG